MKRMLWAVLAMCGCGGTSDVPSCQEAITHFYGAGCMFDGTSGPTSQQDAMSSCTGISMDAPDSCRDEFDDWKSCLVGVDNDSQCSDCSSETDALLTCG